MRIDLGAPQVIELGQLFQPFQQQQLEVDFLQDVNPKMQLTGQTGGRQTRLTPCGTRLAVTTGTEWSPAERFVSGVALAAVQQTRL